MARDDAGGRGCRAEARVDSGRVLLSSCVDRGFCGQLEGYGYLRGGELDPLEAAFQASRGLICVAGSHGWAAALEVLSASGTHLDLALVYFDLRRKGRKPKPGVRRGTLVYVHGGRVYEVLVLSEGYPASLGELVEWSRGAIADSHTPIVAVVDRTGLVTYYEARAVTSLS
ncbi:MAG: hypothetical protein F7B20_08045 [Aeropyrum sp.]|nr:hypothetical protein [Aeropyrum sp.]